MPYNWSDLISSIFGLFQTGPSPEPTGNYSSWETEEEKRRRLLEELGITAFEEQAPPLVPSHGSNYLVPANRPTPVRAVERDGRMLMTNLPEYDDLPDFSQYRRGQTFGLSDTLGGQESALEGFRSRETREAPSWGAQFSLATSGMDPRTRGADLADLWQQYGRTEANIENMNRGWQIGETNAAANMMNARTNAAESPSDIGARQALAAERMARAAFKQEELQRLVSGAATPGEIAKLAGVIQRMESNGLGSNPFTDQLKGLYQQYTVGRNVGAMMEGSNENTPGVAPVGAQLPRGLASAPPPTHPVTDKSGRTYYAYVEGEPGFGIQGGRGVIKGGVRYWVVN